MIQETLVKIKMIYDSFLGFLKYVGPLTNMCHKSSHSRVRCFWMKIYYNKKFSPCIIMMSCSSSRSEMFFKIGVFKNFTNFTRKHLCCSLPVDARRRFNVDTTSDVVSTLKRRRVSTGSFK